MLESRDVTIVVTSFQLSRIRCQGNNIRPRRLYKAFGASFHSYLARYSRFKTCWLYLDTSSYGVIDKLYPNLRRGESRSARNRRGRPHCPCLGLISHQQQHLFDNNNTTSMALSNSASPAPSRDQTPNPLPQNSRLLEQQQRICSKPTQKDLFHSQTIASDGGKHGSRERVGPVRRLLVLTRQRKGM